MKALHLSLLIITFIVGTASTDSTSYFSKEKAHTLGTRHYSRFRLHCAALCDRDELCVQAEFIQEEKVCIIGKVRRLMYDGIIAPGEAILGTGIPGPGTGILMYKQEYLLPPKPRHCSEILSQQPSAPSGVYNIWPDGVTQSRVWCDMDTDGGGWTNVYSYKTLQSVINAGGNAVNPRPTWPLALTGPVAASTTPPSDMQLHGALDFPLWQNIGEEFMIKSNINNWIACTPGTGSFSRLISGSITCRMVKSITINCQSLPTGAFSFMRNQWNRGPAILTPGVYYYFETEASGGYWPTHDPCGWNQANNLLGIHPEGQVWLR